MVAERTSSHCEFSRAHTLRERERERERTSHQIVSALRAIFPIIPYPYLISYHYKPPCKPFYLKL